MAPRPMFCMSGILIFSPGRAPASDLRPAGCRGGNPRGSRLRERNVTREFSNEPNAGTADDVKI